MGWSSRVFIPLRHRFTSFAIGEMVVGVSQKSRTFWQWLSSRTFERRFCGNPPQIFSPMRSPCILRDTTLPKRYLVPPIAFHMKRWEGPIWFDTAIVRRAFLTGKFSFDLLDANCAYANFKLSTRHDFCSVFLAFRANFGSKLLTLSLSRNFLRTSYLSSSLKLFLQLCNTLFRLLASSATFLKVNLCIEVLVVNKPSG
jgi:hypothetical protein